MERPLLTISSKDFQSGIAMLGAHAERGGLFYKAAGITPLFDAGGALANENGFLMSSDAGTAASYGSVTGNILNAIPHDQSAIANCNMIAVTSANKICRVEFDSNGAPNGALTTIFTAGGTMTPGIAFIEFPDGNKYILYRQTTNLGSYETGGSTQNDTLQGLTADFFGSLHFHYALNKFFMGNGTGKICSMTVGATLAASTFKTDALTFDKTSIATDISDDGQYVVIAITRNTTATTTMLYDSKILYWDGSSTTGYLKDFTITDPLIYALRKTPMGLFAFGITGIWQVSFDGVKKIFNHSPGIYTASGASALHYGRGATSFFSDALLWGGMVGSTNTVTAVKSLGKLDSAALSAYLNPFLGPVAKNITFVSGQLSKGYVFVADDTPQLKYYQVGGGGAATGVTAQTVYFPLPQPVDITHVDVIFGEPLASGDTLDLDIFKDEDTAVTDFGSVSYDANKTIRRYQFRQAGGGFMNVNQQLALKLTFTAGAVKIKRIEVFGQAVERTNV